MRHSNKRTSRACFEQHYTAVFNYCLRRTGEPQDAADAVAESFTIAWRRYNDLPAEPLPWLYGVARKVLANQRRSYERQAAVTDRIKHEPAPEPRSAGSLESIEAGMALMALNMLAPRDREVLTLIAWENLSPSDAAKSLGISLTAFNVRLHRARKRLKDQIEECDSLHDDAWSMHIDDVIAELLEESNG